MKQEEKFAKEYVQKWWGYKDEQTKNAIELAFRAGMFKQEAYATSVLSRGEKKIEQRKYFFKIEIRGKSRVEEFIATSFWPAYKLFEKRLGKPEPQIIAVWSESLP